MTRRIVPTSCPKVSPQHFVGIGPVCPLLEIADQAIRDMEVIGGSCLGDTNAGTEFLGFGTPVLNMGSDLVIHQDFTIPHSDTAVMNIGTSVSSNGWCLFPRQDLVPRFGKPEILYRLHKG